MNNMNSNEAQSAQTDVALAGQAERCVIRLPVPSPTYCCGDRLRACKRCGADVWKSLDDTDYGYAVFNCDHCGNTIYVELPQ